MQRHLPGVDLAGARVAWGRAIDQFGVVTLEPAGNESDWTATVRDTGGNPITVCRIEGTSVSCVP